MSYCSDIIYSEPFHHFRHRAEPQTAAEQQQRRRGDEILQLHHGLASSLGNGQMRVQSNLASMPTATAHPTHPQHHRRDGGGGGSVLAYDPHFSHLLSSALDRRESSASATSSVGSFESGSTLTSDLGGAGGGGGDAIMTRLRKSFEQKEEFLRGSQSQMSSSGGSGEMGKTNGTGLWFV